MITNACALPITRATAQTLFAWPLSRQSAGRPRRYLNASVGYGDLFVLTWFVASAATVGGALGTGLASDEAIRAAAYSKREEERRDRLARERT